MGVTTISLVCSGFVLLASDPIIVGRSTMCRSIDLRGGRVSGVSKGTIEGSRASEQIGWVDHASPKG
jgi:hypothetical protein